MVINPNLSGLIAIIMWSISPLLIIGAGDTPPLLMAGLTLAFAGVVLLLFFMAQKKSVKTIFKVSPLAYLTVIGGIGGYVVFWFMGFRHAPAFEANTLNYTWPMMLVVLSAIITRERISPLQWLGSALSFSGIVVLFTAFNNVNLDVQYIEGYFYAFLIVTGVLCLGLHYILEDSYFPGLLEIMFLVVLGLTRISFVFWDYAMKHGQVRFIGSLSYFIPVISMLLLMAFNHLPRNNLIALSAFLVICGCVVMNGDKIKAILNFKS